MKNLLFIFLFCLTSITLRGQWNNNQTLNDPIWDTKEMSGDHLIKGGTYMLIGISISTLGSVINMYLTSPAYLENYYPTKNSHLIGIFSGLIGTTFNIVGIVHIIKSGKKHNKENDMSLKLTPTNNGLGLCLNL